MDRYDVVAQLTMSGSKLAQAKLETLLEQIESTQMDRQLAYETMHSFVSDLRAMTAMVEAVFTLDTASITHPHGMTDEVRKQRNALLAIPRKLCRAEAVQRWDQLQQRWEQFTKAMDSTP